MKGTPSNIQETGIEGTADEGQKEENDPPEKHDIYKKHFSVISFHHLHSFCPVMLVLSCNVFIAEIFYHQIRERKEKNPTQKTTKIAKLSSCT